MKSIDNELVMKFASVCRIVAEAEEDWWSFRVQYARDTEDAAREFCADRSERTALILLGRAIVAHRDAPDAMGYEHIMWAAAAHIMTTNHPMAEGLAQVPAFSGSSAAEGRAMMFAVIQVWDAWMKTLVLPERNANELMALDELEVREL